MGAHPWRNRILLVLFLALLAFNLMILSRRYQAGREERQPLPETSSAPVGTPLLEKGTYKAIAYRTDSASLSFSADERGRWHWDGDPDFPLEESTVTRILEAVTSLRVLDSAEEPGELSRFGFDNPSAEIRITPRRGTETILLLGKTLADGSGCYAQLNRDESVAYTVDGVLTELLSVPLYDLCALPELPKLTEENIQTVVLRGPGQDEDRTLTIISGTAPEQGRRRWLTAVGDQTDSAVLRALLEDLERLAFTRCVDYYPSEGAPALCGLETPAAEAEITWSGEDPAVRETLRLELGARLPDGSGRYARLSGEEPIYFLPTDLLDPLMTVARQGPEALKRAG